MSRKPLAAQPAEASHRLSMNVPQRSLERLERLRTVTEAASYTEVVKQALRLYEAVVEGKESGANFYMEKDGVRSSFFVA